MIPALAIEDMFLGKGAWRTRGTSAAVKGGHEESDSPATGTCPGRSSDPAFATRCDSARSHRGLTEGECQTAYR
jgi:hypothetical protein